jgi:L-rhamnono-1,4-lactonase
MPTCQPPTIIDSHIHLYARSHLPTLRWALELPSNHVLKCQNSIEEYRSAISTSAANLRGFVFIESDRISSLSENDWAHALDEIDFVARILNGEPRDGLSGGFEVADKKLVLAIVPWAPVPLGAKIMEKYMALTKQHCKNEEVWKKIKGVRYLVQDKPSRVTLEPGFIDGLKWLGEKGLTFDLGVDARKGGMWQLREACEMLRLIHENDDREGTGEIQKPKIVINHLCKPNLRLTAEDIASAHAEYEEWKDYIREMAGFEGTFMKLSGGFSELQPSQDWEDPECVNRIVTTLKPWTDVVFDAFGPSRTMFGSDWPVCNVGGPAVELSWQCWHDVADAILSALNLAHDEKLMVWSGTAQLAYSIP